MPESLAKKSHFFRGLLESNNYPQRKRCDLCSLPIGRSQVQGTVNAELFSFCCPGCLHVFLILSNTPGGPPADFKQTELYRACVATGLIPADEKTEPAGVIADHADLAAASASFLHEEDFAQELTLRVEGMWCTACAWLIEQVLGRTEGILDVSVMFFSDLVRLKYLPHRLQLQDVHDKISKLGYRTSALREESQDAKERKRLLLHLGVSCILTANIMMISLALYAGFFQELGEEAIAYLSYPLWLLATPVVFYAGFPILKRAVLGLRFGALTMDSLITVGTLSAYCYSVVRMSTGSLHLYFDTAAMLVTLVLLGRYIEMHARSKVAAGISELYRLANQKARLQLPEEERWIAAEALRAGDLYRVLSGERVPVDGCVVTGAATVDESFLTGESRPVRRSVGDAVMGGALLLDGDLRVRATRVGGESSLGQMIHLMQEALAGKNSMELLADRITRWLVPLILVLAAGTSLLLHLLHFSADEALLRALTVLVITCPCALGIATPLAKVAAIGAGRSRGILVRDTSALEHVKDLDVMVFDKTGTLTEGNFTLREVVTTAGTAEEAMGKVAALEVHSDHFLGREIMRQWDVSRGGLQQVTDFESLEGLGVKGLVQDELIAAGNRQMMELQGFVLDPALHRDARLLESDGKTIVFYGWGNSVRGFLVFGDTLKENSRQVVSGLQQQGLVIWLVSGDSRETTRAVAQELGIAQFAGQAMPQDKVEIIKEQQAKGCRVAMIGDGINDAAALARADVGIALGTGATIAQEASAITILAKDPEKIPEVLQLSTITSRIIRQNLFFAFLYNALGIPLAMAGMLNPLLAVFAMFASSLTVIGNTLRITRSWAG